MATNFVLTFVPRIFVAEMFVGGIKELCSLDDGGVLDKRLTDNVVREL